MKRERSFARKEVDLGDKKRDFLFPSSPKSKCAINSGVVIAAAGNFFPQPSQHNEGIEREEIFPFPIISRSAKQMEEEKFPVRACIICRYFTTSSLAEREKKKKKKKRIKWASFVRVSSVMNVLSLRYDFQSARDSSSSSSSRRRD